MSTEKNISFSHYRSINYLFAKERICFSILFLSIRFIVLFLWQVFLFLHHPSGSNVIHYDEWISQISITFKDTILFTVRGHTLGHFQYCTYDIISLPVHLPNVNSKFTYVRQWRDLCYEYVTLLSDYEKRWIKRLKYVKYIHILYFKIRFVWFVKIFV